LVLDKTDGGGSNAWVREDRVAGRFKVSRHAFVDPEILEIERELVFDRSWLYIGHESELPNANDFVTRSVGGRELIFNRDRTGQIRAFYNTCPHRGAQVVREPHGNAMGFQCFYHGWAFNNNGVFATKFKDGNFPPDFNNDGCANLPPVARFESYRGFYFVSFLNSIQSLYDYLADAKDYLDCVGDQSAAGMEIVPGEQAYSMRANWKLLVENSIDGYHAASTHVTYFDYLAKATGGMADMSVMSLDGNQRSRGIDLGNGHAVVEGMAPWGRPVANWIPAWGEEGKLEIERIRKDLDARLGVERADRIARKSRNLLIFPNLIINDVMAITVRTFYPVSPDYMKVNAWAIAPKDETSQMRKWRLFNYLEFLGPGGFATPDDNEALEACHKGYKNLREAGWNDISKGMLRADPFGDDENQMRAFWREWARRTREAAPTEVGA
jgi:p-cumate 2,3-dioxygenase alpha subunit